MVVLSETLLAAILAAQITQIAFEAGLLRRVSQLEVKVEERTEPATEVSND